MADAKPASGKPIVDVAHPSKPELSEASRPALITSRPVLKERAPAVEVTASPLEERKAEKQLIKTVPVKLTPLPEPTSEASLAEADPQSTTDAASESTVPTQDAKSTPATATDEGTATKETELPTTAPSDEKAATDQGTDKPAEPQPETSSETETTADESDAGTTVDPAGIEAEAAKQAEHDEAMQKLIDSKQYYVPINSVEQRKTKNFVIIGIVLSVLLIGAWLDIAVDASLVNLPFNVPHTHLFATTTTTTNTTTAPAAQPASSLFATYTSTKDSLSFQYPKTWALDTASTLQGQEVTVNPPKTANDTYVGLERSLPSSSTTVKLDFIHYVAFVSGTHHLFYRQVVYHDPSAKQPTYVPAASVTDVKGTEKIGDSAPSLAGFKTGASTTYLETYSLADKNGATYATVTAARAYLQTANAKAAQKLLTSVKF